MREARPGQVLQGRYRLAALRHADDVRHEWRAHDLVTGRNIFITKLLPPTDSDRTSTTWINEQVRKFTVLRDSASGDVYDLIIENEALWFVTKPVTESLEQRIRWEGSLTTGQATDLATTLLKTLAAIHRTGLVGMDITSRTVLFTEAGSVILDPSAVATASFGRAGTLVHPNPAYTAPEVIRGGRNSTASDVYALGAVLFEALEAFPPHQRSIPIAPLIRDPSGGLQQVVMDMIAWNPAHRPTAEQALGAVGRDGGSAPPTAAAGGSDAAAARYVKARTVSWPALLRFALRWLGIGVILAAVVVEVWTHPLLQLVALVFGVLLAGTAIGVGIGEIVHIWARSRTRDVGAIADEPLMVMDLPDPSLVGPAAIDDGLDRLFRALGFPPDIASTAVVTGAGDDWQR